MNLEAWKSLIGEPLLVLIYITVIAIASFFIPLVIAKLQFGRQYLIGLLPIYLLTGNVLAESFCEIDVGPFKSIVVSLAIPVYAATFLITDILSEFYGKEQAKHAVWLGFIGQIFFVVSLFVVLRSPIYPDKLKNFETTLSFLPRLMVASAISYFISQFVDVYLFHKIRTLTGERLKWLRNNCATCVAQFLDTVIFLLIGFYGKKIGEVMSASGIAEPVLLTGKLWWTFVFSTWAIKFLVALFDTPFFYWATMREAKK